MNKGKTTNLATSEYEAGSIGSNSSERKNYVSFMREYEFIL